MRGNGHLRLVRWSDGDKGVVVRLDSGYEVRVRANSYAADLQRLAQALLGEYYLPTLDETDDGDAAAERLREGVARAIGGLSRDDLRVVAGCLLWIQCVDEWQKRKRKRKSGDNPKGHRR